MESSTTTIEFTRIYLALFYTFVAAFYAIRITTEKRCQQHEVVFPGSNFSATWWNHMVFRVFRATIWAVCVVRVFSPAVDSYLGIIPALYISPVVIAGNILLTGGFLFTMAVHLQLGHQWRSGIDPNAPPQLWTCGPYSVSRNPMFLGIAAAQAGFFFALPSVFSAVCLLLGWYTLHRQTREEEAYLLDRFPSHYAAYSDRVRRWL